MDIFELYKKCIKGECTPEEASLVENWLKDHPEAFEPEMLSEMLGMGDPTPMPAGVREQMLVHFSEKGLRLGQALQKGRLVRIGARGRRNRIMVWAAAAVFLAAVLTGAWWYSGNEVVARPRSWATIENPGNGVKLVILPDSSRIWLNAYAQIRYTIEEDKRSDREIQLTGEAYFKVQAQAGRSFTVKAGNIRTLVLGTEFNMEAYPDEAMVRVSLRKGKVQVNCLDAKGITKDAQLLEPGEAATYHKGNEYLSIGRTVAKEPEAWIREGIVLNDAALGDVLARIGRKYNKKIVFDAGQAGKFNHITASYHKADIDEVLTQLGFTCNFKFKKDSNTNTYTISFKRERSQGPPHK